MAPEYGPVDTTLPPDDAFAVLGNETRMEILQTLGSSAEPLPFSELRDRVGVSDSGQFNYHLGKLEGHFLRKGDDGYELRQPGRRVIEAVLSGAVTETHVVEPTRLDSPCPYCGADIEVSYQEEAVLIRCTECIGSFGGRESTMPTFETLPEGTLTLYQLPSAGLPDRTPSELLATALSHTYIDLVAFANGFCPRCTAPARLSVEVCRNHAPDGAICPECNGRFEVGFTAVCTNCGSEKTGTIKHLLLGDPRVRSFFESRGIDTLAPNWADIQVFYSYVEDVLEYDPFEAEFTFAVGADELTVAVDEDLNVIETTVNAGSHPD